MMELLPFQAASILSTAFVALLSVVLLLNLLGLPSNWIILGLVALWQYLNPFAPHAGMWFWIVMVFLAIAGEIAENFLQVLKGRHYGSSTSGSMAAFIGGIIGAIFCAPLFWGIGALFGALAGAWLACLLMELLKNRPLHEALNSAFGSLLGRLMGAICKMGVGAVMIILSLHLIRGPVDTPPPTPTDDAAHVAISRNYA